MYELLKLRAGIILYEPDKSHDTPPSLHLLAFSFPNKTKVNAVVSVLAVWDVSSLVVNAAFSRAHWKRDDLAETGRTNKQYEKICHHPTHIRKKQPSIRNHV